MKSADRSAEKSGNFDELVSKFSENEILNTQAMSYVKGGATDGEGDGGTVVITKPKF
jgi:hypothetical protein